ncbi:MAG: TlpA disulfide reductase family protein [Bacteroidia bacterium]|nr:TlpA disulfide reductase family protein [Bacteroidia bacterium]
MRNLILFLCFFLSTLISFAQAPISLESAEIADRIFDEAHKPKVSGQLLNYDAEKDKDLFIKYVQVQLGPEMQVTHMAEINSDGSFELQLENGLPYQQLWFSIGEYYYAEILANTDLIIKANLDKLRGKDINWIAEGVEFSGNDAAVNRYVNKYISFRNERVKDLQMEEQQLSMNREMELAEKIARRREINEEYVKIEAKFIEKEGSAYAWLLENERLSEFYGQISIMHFGKEMDQSLLDEVFTHHPALVSNAGHAYYNYMGMMLQAFKTDEFLKKIENFPSVKASLIKMMAQPEDLYRRKAFLEKVLPGMEDGWVKTQMQNTYEADIKHIVKIEESLKNTPPEEGKSNLGINKINFGEDTRLYFSTSENTTDLIQNIRGAFEGKAIILDVWATWCGPCISDMKQSKQIKADLKNLPVEVVYLCVADGSSEEKWKKKVAELELKGNHIFLNRKLSGELMSHFKFQGYPSYAFIDKEGKVYLDYISGISRIDLEDLKKKL